MMRRALVWLLLVGILGGCRAAAPGTVVGPAPLASISRQLTFSPANDFSPVFGLDGRSVLYVSDQTGTGNLWLVDAQGTTPRALTFDRSQYYSPVFTPDGTAIIVASDRGAATPAWTDLWRLDRQGTLEQRVLSSTANEKEFFPTVSRDGRLLAYLNLPMDRPPKYRLTIAELPGGIPRMLTEDGVVFAPIRLSPDGRQILFTTDRMLSADVWVMGIDGSGARGLTMQPGAESTGDWSLDGSTIVYVSDQTGSDELWLMDPQGQNRRQLTYDRATASSPAFSPDGAWVVYASTKSGNQDLWVIASGLSIR